MDIANYRVEGFVKITNDETGEVLLEKKNAIHFGNLAASIATALAGQDTGHIRYMAFGNGGTTISPAGEITYKKPDVDTVKNTGSSLYSEIYHQEIGRNGNNNTGADPDNSVIPISTNTSYSDIKMVCTLTFDGVNQISQFGSQQGPIDNSDNFGTGTLFDEIALYTGQPNIPISTTLADTRDALMISHVIFHPILKANNRKLKIDYTIRIYLEAL
jgi:hypothetical protein